MKWFEKQTKEVKEIVVDSFKRIEQGNFSNCKLLRNGISEIKINFAAGIRIYYTKNGNEIIILLWGGANKKRQSEDIEKAIQIKRMLEV
jgi:putative addiction module killer protein